MRYDVTDTIADLVRRHAGNAPDSPALIAEGQAPLTYSELARQMDRLQLQFNAMGFGRGDRIATVGPNDAATAALIVGIWGCAVAVPMNPALSENEFVAYLRDQKVQAVAVVPGAETSVQAAARKAGLPVLDVRRHDDEGAGRIDFHPVSPPGIPARPGAADLDDLALVLTTSGTTSHSKVVPVTNAQLTVKARRYAGAMGLGAADRCLNLMPLFHGHGIQGSLAAVLASGGSLITLREFSVEAFFRLLRSLAPTWYTGSYTFQHTLHAAAPAHLGAIGDSRLRFIRTASGHLDTQIADEIESMFHALVIEPYACTETSVISCPPLPPAVRKPGTVGLPVDGKVAIVDEDNRFLPAGERGEVVVNSVKFFTGYENDPTANKDAFFDGWFRTGDEGVLDTDGYLTLTGRIKDIINRGGEKITPSEVDAVLTSHPDIARAVTFPIPHATLGQEVAAAVVPIKGAVLSDEIVARYLRGRLTPFKVPRKILIVDDIPVNAAGKVARRSLAEAFGLTAALSASPAGPRGDERPATKLEAKLQRLWAEVLRLDRVGLHEDFFMLGGDSLQAVEMFLRIEKDMGRRLPRSILFEAGTVTELAKCIERTEASRCLVLIQPNGDRAPFFSIHDGNGQVLNYRDLARLVGEKQPFYGVQCLGLDGQTEPFTNIDDMAAYYVSEIKKVQPKGPYYIGGYSFGGRVAYVMAQQMRAAGDEIALLALFDVYSQAGRVRVAFGDWLGHHWERIKALPLRQLPSYVALRLSNLWTTIYMRTRLKSYAAAWHFFKHRGKPLPRFLYRPVAANDMVRAGYRARPYDGDAVLFKAERYAWTHADQHEGWHSLIKGKLEIRPISGRHYEIVKPPHVQTLARELADALDKAHASADAAQRSAKAS